MRRTVSTALLFSSLIFTAAANASTISDDASATTPQVSTGVTPPQALNSLTIAPPDPMSGHALPAGGMVTLSFTVDETGQIRNIQILKGFDPYWNALVTNAVQNLRYRPAMLDNRPVSMAVTLNVNLI